MKKIKRFIPVAEPWLGKEEEQAVAGCVREKWISSAGKKIDEFEERFADFCRTRYACCCSNGTAALHLSLLAMGIGRGDEVIVPSLTFIATANAVAYTGAKPIFADSEPLTWNIDPSQIKKLITRRTKAVIPVHLYGHPADMDDIVSIAKKAGIGVVEDASEAHGAAYKSKPVGSIGDVGTFSFYGNKIITTGEGGMVTTNNKKLYQAMRRLRDHAMDKNRRYWHDSIGYNYRMTNLQAAIGIVQLKKIKRIIKRKREIACWYRSMLKDIPGLTMPPDERWATTVFWMFSILVKEDFGISRDIFMKKLLKQGIDSRNFFFPMHKLPPYHTKQRLLVSERLSKQGLNLPSSPTLTRNDVRRITKAISSLKKG